jgi:hypothetical protein
LEGIRELTREVAQMRGTSVRRTYVSRRHARRRLWLVLGAAAIVMVLVSTLSGGGARSFSVPSRADLAGLNPRQRIVAIVNSQVGYRTDPRHSYCNKFSAYWGAGNSTCPSGELSEEWCADFAAWAWRKAGLRFAYGYGPGELNGRAASFYEWAVDNGEWHPARSGYLARPGDVAVYGLSLGSYTTASHVAVVTSDPSGQRGPDVVNGDGDRTGFSAVEAGTDQWRADSGRHSGDGALLAGYVSP